jgi:hypothetical protein
MKIMHRFITPTIALAVSVNIVLEQKRRNWCYASYALLGR